MAWLLPKILAKPLVANEMKCQSRNLINVYNRDHFYAYMKNNWSNDANTPDREHHLFSDGRPI